MIIARLKDFFISDILLLDTLMKKIGAGRKYTFFGVVLASFGAIFEAVSIALLMPTLQGVFSMDFKFVWNIPFLGPFILFLTSLFPGLFKYYNSATFIVLVFLIFAAILLKNIAYYTSNIFFSHQIRVISNNMRRLIFARFLSFGKQFFDRENRGHLQSVLNNFTNQISGNTRRFFYSLINFSMLFAYISIMFVISWKLSLLVLLLFPLLYLSLKWIITKIEKTSDHYADFRNRINNFSNNIFSCIPLVKAYDSEKKEIARFGELSETCSMLEFSQSKKIGLINPLQEIVLITFIIFLVSVTAYMVVKTKTTSIASLLVFFYALKRSSTMFNFLGEAKSNLAEMHGPIKEVLSVFDDSDKFFIKDGYKKFTGLKKDIVFDNLRFSYTNEIPVLKSINFSVEKGRITAIVGSTGSGKTTIVNLLMRFYEISKRSIIVDGIDIKEFTLESLKKHIALVSQDTLLFNDTLRANLVYGLDKKIRDKILFDVLKKARLYNFVKKLPEGLSTFIGDKGVKLSGGEKQRLSIARALLKGSEILILDEATSSLDSRTERLIHEAIYEAIKGKTAIIIAHRLFTIRHADRIIVIEKGKIVEQGSLKSLLKKKGLFYSYWQEQRFY
jgi:subfamily B ATP-binding cassette protein MsbA